jgi:hypothetical protein
MDTVSSPTAEAWCGLHRQHWQLEGALPGKEREAGDHRRGGVSVRQWEWVKVVEFVSGEGLPVVGDDSSVVLQLWARDEEVRRESISKV